MTMLSDRELLDALKEQFDLANDCQLCDMLAMSPTQISHIRAVINPRPLTLMQKLVAYDHLGYAWAREALLNLVPDHLGAKLRAMDIDKTKAAGLTAMYELTFVNLQSLGAHLQSLN